MVKTISIIGAGRVGIALALALQKAGYHVTNLVFKDEEKLRYFVDQTSNHSNVLHELNSVNRLTIKQFVNCKSELVIFTTQDEEIRNAADAVVKIIVNNPIIFHTSGSLSSQILDVFHKKDCKTASLHPLVSISDPILGSERFKDAYFCLEGDDEAVIAGEKLVADLGGHAFSIESRHKPLYHAAAVVACGHFVALLSAALEMLKNCGLDSQTSKKILLPLVESTLENLKTQTPAQALTGTFARGDIQTLGRHLEALKSNSELLEIYSMLGKRSLKLAESQGVDPSRTAKMLEILNKIQPHP
jgi:predicted short-subunit dehydrogenase-like oxidoreductase (DUF2520 family)